MEMKQALHSLNGLDSGTINESSIELWECLAASVEERYEQFHESVSLYDAESRLPVIIPAKVYEGILMEYAAAATIASRRNSL